MYPTEEDFNKPDQRYPQYSIDEVDLPAWTGLAFRKNLETQNFEFFNFNPENIKLIVPTYNETINVANLLISSQPVHRTRIDTFLHETFPEYIISHTKIHECLLKPDTKHQTYYDQCLKAFSDWFSSKEKSPIDPFVHLTKLKIAATFPQYDQENFPLTIKQRKAIELIESALENNEKILFISENNRFLTFMHNQLKAKDISSELINNPASLKKYAHDSQTFLNSNVLLTSLLFNDGMYCSDISTIIIMERPFEPLYLKRILSRYSSIRQKNQTNIYILDMKGTIDEHLKDLFNSGQSPGAYLIELISRIIEKSKPNI